MHVYLYVGSRGRRNAGSRYVDMCVKEGKAVSLQA